MDPPLAPARDVVAPAPDPKAAHSAATAGDPARERNAQSHGPDHLGQPPYHAEHHRGQRQHHAERHLAKTHDLQQHPHERELTPSDSADQTSQLAASGRVADRAVHWHSARATQARSPGRCKTRFRKGVTPPLSPMADLIGCRGKPSHIIYLASYFVATMLAAAPISPSLSPSALGFQARHGRFSIR